MGVSIERPAPQTSPFQEIAMPTNTAREAATPSMEKLLVLSTGHLDPATGKALGEGANFGVSDVWRTQFGWGFSVAALGSAAEEGGALPTCLSDAHALAERMEATVLLFDCDGQSIDGLGVWCW
jgi:hypothetical protein